VRVLAISAHTDDAIVLAGGTLARFVEEGYDVFLWGLSLAEESIPETFHRKVLNAECHRAAEKLGISTLTADEECLIFSHHDVRHFPEHRQQILDDMIQVRKFHGPDLVLVHAATDLHQDHQVVHQEALRAFRKCSIYAYDFAWNSMNGQHLNLFVSLTEEQISKKIDAVQCFKSQVVKGSPYFAPEYIRGLAVERGSRIGVRLAEAFEVVREIR